MFGRDFIRSGKKMRIFAKKPRKQHPKSDIWRIAEVVAASPLNADFHIELSEALGKANRLYAAHAQLRSAAFLQKRDGAESVSIIRPLVPQDQILRLDHNQYFRFKTLADKVQSLSGGKPVSILDVGGGDGQLAHFLPEADYFLVEPSLNGISAERIPFGSKEFDYVVCCHVLEHIDPENRVAFLDSLLERATRGLILLNPFFNARFNEKDRFRLVIQVTNAQWAKEHLDCGLPELDFVKRYAKERKLKFSSEPNGFMPLGLAMVFCNYFASSLGRIDDMSRINKFFNVNFTDFLNEAGCSNSYLVTLVYK